MYHTFFKDEGNQCFYEIKFLEEKILELERIKDEWLKTRDETSLSNPKIALSHVLNS